jgi:hypothetical protein
MNNRLIAPFRKPNSSFYWFRLVIPERYRPMRSRSSTPRTARWRMSLGDRARGKLRLHEKAAFEIVFWLISSAGV